MSERQSSFDGGLPFPAPGNVHHSNRPKSMMMLLMMMMMRLMIGDKLTTYCLVTAILLRGTQEWRKERRRIDSPSSVSSTPSPSSIHLMRRRRIAPPCFALLCVSVIASRWQLNSPHLPIILSLLKLCTLCVSHHALCWLCAIFL